MFPYYFYHQPYYVNSLPYQPEVPHERNDAFAYDERQPVHGQVTWTYGGPVTKCEVPWSENNYMTAAVGENSPYQCGQFIRLKNIQAPYGREVVVMVVDEVEGYPANRLNIHRKAFEALGVNPNIGVLNVEIIPFSNTEQGEWGTHAQHIVHAAFPNYRIMDYKRTGKAKVSRDNTKETYHFTLQNQHENINVQVELIYNSTTNKLITINVKEV